jgi:predicted acylesterase/phospholipase RssA
MRARISHVLGSHWGGIAQALDVITMISMVGAIGGLPTLLDALTRYARFAGRRLQDLHWPRLPIMASVFLVGLLALQGCAQTAIREPTASREDAPNSIRTLGPDQRFTTVSSQTVAGRVRAQRAGQPVTILALSGGGADGAFGAGALVGLTRSISRPQFSVVTGVSTGALIAPYAFLGSDWDDELLEVYTSGRAEHLLKTRGLSALFGSSLYSGTPLKELVDRYATDALIQAVAREAATGRLLLVATTDVSTGEPVIWDLGSIAMNGGAGARALFRDVLVASASVPGLLPPVVIRVQEQQALYDEVHVDGSISVPFFVPLAFVDATRDAGEPSHGVTVFVIVDGRLSEQAAPIRLRARSILSRSVSAGLNHMLRTTLELTATDTQLKGAQFQFAAIPVGYPELDPFDFRTPSMRSLFQYGYQCARAGRLWASSHGVGRDEANGDGSGHANPCPADDAFIGRLAVR